MIMRFSLWRDYGTDGTEFVMFVTQHNKSVSKRKVLKLYPLAERCGDSFCGDLTGEVLDSMKKNYTVVFA